MNYDWLDGALSAVSFGATGGNVTLLLDSDQINSQANLEDFVGGIAKVQEPGIVAAGRFDFFCRDILIFIEELSALSRDLAGVATLASDDDNFALTIEMDKGAVRIGGHLRARYDTNTLLSYSFLSDQSYITEPLKTLRSFVVHPHQ